MIRRWKELGGQETTLSFMTLQNYVLVWGWTKTSNDAIVLVSFKEDKINTKEPLFLCLASVTAANWKGNASQDKLWTATALNFR